MDCGSIWIRDSEEDDSNWSLSLSLTCHRIDSHCEQLEDTCMKRVLITIMLGALMAGIPVFAGARNMETRTGANTMAATYSPEPASPQYRRRNYRERARPGWDSARGL